MAGSSLALAEALLSRMCLVVLLGVINGRGCRALRADSSPPGLVPRSLKQLVHPFHRHALRFGRPKGQHDETDRAHACPEDVSAPYIEALEHVGRDTHDSKLEEPMNDHVGGVADAPDAGGIDFRAVQVLHGAEANGPPHGIYKDGGDGCIGRSLVLRVDPDAHVDGHVDVGDALQEQAGNEGRAAAEDVDEAPGEDHCEDELDGAVGPRGDEGLVVAADAGVLEDFGDVVGDAVAAAPLGHGLHHGAEEKARAVRGYGGNLLNYGEDGRVREDVVLAADLLVHVGELLLELGVVGGPVAQLGQGCEGGLVAVLGGQPAGALGDEE